tara:strand:+ start:3576 stop:4262 length:687 start_codon:yes stop_codon:yes gene_type:complete
MTLDKILVGDDKIDFAKNVFPYIPNAEIEFVDNPEEVIAKAQSGEYNLIVTDLMYTPTGQEGFNVLEKLKNIDSRKILWTGNAYEKGVRKKAEDLGAEVLDKDEIGSIVGLAVSKTPLKKDGNVLIYCPNPNKENVLYKAMEQVIGTLFDRDKIKVSSNLKEELSKGEYGLVIDSTPMYSQGENLHGVVAHDMKYMFLPEVPRVVSLYDVSTLIRDIGKAVSQFYKEE